MGNLKLTYDHKADAAYLQIKAGKVVRTLEIYHHIMIDLDRRDNLLGIEILLNSKAKSKAIRLDRFVKTFSKLWNKYPA